MGKKRKRLCFDHDFKVFKMDGTHGLYGKDICVKCGFHRRFVPRWELDKLGDLPDFVPQIDPQGKLI